MVAIRSAWVAVLLAACTRPGAAHTGGPPPSTVPSPTSGPTTTAGGLTFAGPIPKNLLVISIDTFRRDHLGKYSDLGITPNLSNLMDQGYTLDNHVACSNWTFASTACAMNGRLNEENGFMPELANSQPLPDGPQLATWLHDQGFYSILASGNSWFSDTWNNAQGFDEPNHAYGTAIAIYSAGRDFLLDAIARGAVTDRWYLHVHVMEPHAPYVPPASYLGCEDDLPPLPGAWDLGTKDGHYDAAAEYNNLTPDDEAILKAHFDCRYNGEIKYLDDQIPTIWADLQQNGLLDDTLVVFWNDHGEQMWEHGSESHAHQIYAEENNAFLFFWAADLVPGSTDAPTQSIDLVPTLLEVFGRTDLPPEVTGLPLGTAPADRVRYALTSARNGTISSVRKLDYKEIYNWRTGIVEMYDDATDPAEQTDLFAPDDPLALDLWSLLGPQILLTAPSILDDVPVWPPDLPEP